MTAILGISAFYHDSAAAIVVDGQIVAAAQEERFTREKHDASFPSHAIQYCLKAADLKIEEVDFIGFYEKPLLKFDRWLQTCLSFAPAGFWNFARSAPSWMQQKIHLRKVIRKKLGGQLQKRLVFLEHHESHAASAFFPSPFDSAAILTLDGVGEWATSTIGTGTGNCIELTREMRFPHSLGLLYAAVTSYCGFQVNGGEYKLMGLAPYGEPVYADVIRQRLVDLKEDGSFRLDMKYFHYCQGSSMTSKRFHRLFGGPPRHPDSEIQKRHMDLAASIQLVTEEIVLKLVEEVARRTEEKSLCLAGGVALNCVANGRVLREGPFENLWIQPAAGDAGGALGTALLIWYQLLNNPRSQFHPSLQVHPSLQGNSCFGPSFSDDEICQFLNSEGASFELAESDEALCQRVAASLAEGKIVGWMQGRMEFGPRALGNRSILGDPRDPEMQQRINQRIKFRESFRPFAPAVLKERAHEYFDIEQKVDSPYMLLVADVEESRRVKVDDHANGFEKLKQVRSEIPAVTHVNHSARVQTVSAEENMLFHMLLSEFNKQTGCPILVNTSFNVRDEPIVCSPQDAYRCFLRTDMDMLVLGHVILMKE